jgi:hypothetical protein
MLPFVEKLKKTPLHDHTQKGHSQRGKEKSHPEPQRASAESLRDSEGHEGAYHVKGTVGHIGNTQHPEDEAQAGGNYEKDRRPAQTHKNLA